MTVTGTNFHPDMQVWIAGVNSPWTKVRKTPTGILIKKSREPFPKGRERHGRGAQER